MLGRKPPRGPRWEGKYLEQQDSLYSLTPQTSREEENQPIGGKRKARCVKES